MEPEINASEYPEPAQLAHEIRSKVGQLYVDCVWVKFAHRKAMVRPGVADQICKGLMMADELPQKKPDAFALFSIAYRVSQKVDERYGRNPQKYTPQEAWERLDSTHRLMWQDEASVTPQDIAETMPPRVGWDQLD